MNWEQLRSRWQGSPEGHISCRSPEADIGVLKMKQTNGPTILWTQLCGIWNSLKDGWIRYEGRSDPPVDGASALILIRQQPLTWQSLPVNGCDGP